MSSQSALHQLMVSDLRVLGGQQEGRRYFIISPHFCTALGILSFKSAPRLQWNSSLMKRRLGNKPHISCVCVCVCAHIHTHAHRMQKLCMTTVDAGTIQRIYHARARTLSHTWALWRARWDNHFVPCVNQKGQNANVSLCVFLRSLPFLIPLSGSRGPRHAGSIYTPSQFDAVTYWKAATDITI